ncbi:hypothetical protein [Roseofilum capinflatum]|uniref:Uncharacterized protein n=1 Tax=Roseofilum capinflatum BLCC-M114 TaxID=3022440 RepID=A0ABT7B7C1_9CYAN|nr:hypothetical protein [Roseofilum capinflatum]MDJ1174188.1 hypothetical protein [Roseofilum capinflatum BLCC-M114]
MTNSDSEWLSDRRDQWYAQFWEQEAGYHSERLAVLDRGIDRSPYADQIPEYGDRLKQAPQLSAMGGQDYPLVGELPSIIDEQALDFLHPDIKNACICVGGWHDGQFQGRWLGRNALEKVQFWSSTKIFPLLNTLTQLTGALEGLEIGDRHAYYPFEGILEDLVTYQEKYCSSNAIAATLKCFQTYLGLEQWVKDLTGHRDLNFQGLYGEAPFTPTPQIVDLHNVRLSAVNELKSRRTQPGENLIPAYVLTRILSLVGWHHHLPEAAQIPGLESGKLQLLTSCLGKDTARFVDLAIHTLGIDIQNPIILSKMGFGYSSSRRRTEMTYTGFVQFEHQNQLNALTLTLRGARALNNPDQTERENQEAIEIDARMTTEITEIIRRFILNRL